MNQLTHLYIITFIILAFCPKLTVFGNNELPTLEELKRLHIEGSDGQNNFNKLNSVFASGRILYYSNDEAVERAFRIYKKKPNKFRSFYETKTAKKLVQLEVIYNGEDAVQIFSHGGREVYREKLEGKALEAIDFESRMEGPFLMVMEENKQFIDILRFEYVDGENCILLKVDERSKFPYRNIWLSAQNFQEVKFDRISLNDDKEEQLEEVFFRNFKNIQGILFASRIDKFINSKRSFTTFIDDFNVNYGLYDSLFKVD